MIVDVHHVGIAVRDMDRACAFFRDGLGLPVVKEGEAPARGAVVMMLSAGKGYLELVQPSRKDSPFTRFIEERGEGLHHLALRTDGVDREVSRLRELGAELEDHEPREGFIGRLSYLRPEAFFGAIVEVVEPEEAFAEAQPPASAITRIDHVVLRVPDAPAVCRRMEEWFGVATKRTFERAGHTFAFLRPGDAIIEVIGPTPGGEADSGRLAGLAFEVKGIYEMTAALKAKGFPIGDPHPALQGGRIVSIHHSGACGVPVALIDFTGSPGQPRRSVA